MTSSRSRYLILIFLLLSVLLHWLALRYYPTQLAPEVPAPSPLVVEVRPAQPQRETTLPAPQPPPAVKNVVRRLGIEDRQVPREQAPKGFDPEDSAPTPPRQPPAVKKAVPATKPEPTVAPPLPAETATAPKPPPPLPSLDQLLNAANSAAADVARSAQTKKRDDIARGDVVWLNMEQDRLFSFFSRFKKGIYAVWNYPQQAVEQHQQGVALLKIVINRDGSVEDVDIINSSGHERLDREAIAAIFKAQPYGELPQSYTEPQLTIMAYFEYQLQGLRIFGRQ